MKFSTTLITTIGLVGWWTSLGAQQSILHPTSGSQNVNLAAGTHRYYDSGGSDGDYGPNEGGTLQLCPNNGNDEIMVFFIRSNVEVNGNTAECADFLRVAGDASGSDGDYCGQPGSPPTDQYGTLRPGIRFVSQPGGCLTFTFNSDNSIQFGGWEAIVDVRPPASCDCDPEVCGRRLVCEGFEEYVPYKVSPQSDRWTKGENLGLDGVVSDEVAFAGNYALEVLSRSDSITNVSFLLGDSTSGRYRLSYRVLIPNLSAARFGLQHKETLSHWAYELTLNNNSGFFYIGRATGNPVASFDYLSDQWNNIVQILDLDSDKAELWVNGIFVHSWTFSDGETFEGKESLNQIGALNFVGAGLYYVDDICLTQVDCSPMACPAEEACPVYVNGFRFDDECLACCAGYTAAEWQEETADPRITNFNRNRSWEPSLNDKVFFSPRDSTLLVDFTYIDQLQFKPEDVVLSNYCPDNLTIQVVDERDSAPGIACINFPTTWIVRVDGRETSRYRLKVIVECNDPPVVDSVRLTATGQVFVPGDTIRINTCREEITSEAFEVFAHGCTDDDIAVQTSLHDLEWMDPTGGDGPCYRGAIGLTPFQCNNIGSELDFVVEITDTQGPTFVRPPNRVISCFDFIDSLDLTGRVTDVADNCGIMDTTYTDKINDFDGCSGIILRTWTISDSCGNSTSLVQQINIFDNQGPTFTLPPNVTIEDAADLDVLSVTGMITNVNDNCSVTDTSYVDDRSGLGGCDGLVLRTWIVRDQCGNETRQEQKIIVADAEPPIFTVPADVMIVCQEELDDLGKTGSVTGVSDNVGIMDTAYSDNLNRFDGCSGTVVRTWLVTDVCGNQTAASQRITIRDDIPPTIVVSGEITLTCLDDLEQFSSTNGMVLFTDDNCGLRDTTFTDFLRVINPCSYIVERTWKVTDFCGNVDSAQQIIRVEDKVAPAFTPPPTITVRFDQINDLNVTGRIRNVTDNCGLRDTSYTDRIIQQADCGQQGWIIRTWSIEDWCGNVATSSQEIFIVVEPPVAEAGAGAIISCQQPTAVLNGAGSSAGADFIYRWTTSTGNILSGASTLTPTVNAAGRYFLEVEDKRTGCSATDSVDVSQNNDLQPNLVNKTDVLCNGAATGSIRIAPQGGNPPYRISWSTGAATEVISNLAAGRYTVSVSDQGNCQSTLVINIEEPEPIELVVNALKVASCGGGADGQARVLAAGGTPPYRYSWDNGENTATAVALTAGLHVVQVADANECRQSAAITIGENIAEVSMMPLPSLCIDGAPLQLTTGQPAGGVYSGPGVNQGSFFPDLAGAGQHVLTYTYSAGGCTDTAQAVIKVFGLPALTIGAQDAVCVDASPFEPQFIQPAGGRYSGAGVSNGLFDPAAVGPGSHPVLYTYRDPLTGCSNSAAGLITVLENRTLDIELPFTDTAICQGVMLTVEPEIAGLLSSDVLRWTVNGQQQPLPATSQPLVLDLPAGIYQVEGVVQAANGNCGGLATDTARLQVQVLSNPAPDVSMADTVLCSTVDRYRLRGGVPVGGIYDGPNVINGIFLADRSGPGLYDFSYTVENENGCEQTAFFQVMVDVCTPVEEVGEETVIHLFPNPSSGIFQLEMSGLQEKHLEVRITDQHGRLILRRNLANHGPAFDERLDVSDQPAGVYWVTVKGGQLHQVRRLVVVK